MPTTYLTRAQVAEHYPISAHTLAKLASEGKGPRFYKPTDKCLYRPEDMSSTGLGKPKVSLGVLASSSVRTIPAWMQFSNRP